MPLPFRLEEGIYLEDRQELLAWGSCLARAERGGQPLVSGNYLSWGTRRCFGGQLLHVSVRQDAHYNTAGRLEFVEFAQADADPWGMFETYAALFYQAIGPPTQVGEDGYGHPTHLWSRAEVQIIVGVGERLVEYPIFGIHKGAPFWKLTA